MDEILETKNETLRENTEKVSFLQEVLGANDLTAFVDDEDLRYRSKDVHIPARVYDNETVEMVYSLIREYTEENALPIAEFINYMNISSYLNHIPEK
jgi:hypothetical protein